MSFRITGLSPEPFRYLYGLSDDALAAQGVIRYVTDENSGFPDRIEMRENEPGESFLLLNHVCQPANTPYRATHAIFIREGAEETYDAVDRIPELLRVRTLSLRGFDVRGMMVEGEVIEGKRVEEAIERFFENPELSYIHVHNAARGCYSCRIDRA